MNIEKFIQQYDLQKIKELESTDPQFLALQNARINITNQEKKQDKNLFLYLVLQCALVWYQIAWSWELWREEFWQKISKDRQILKILRNNNKPNNKRRYDFLTTSKYNKRIYNIKTNRLKIFDQILDHTKDFSQYQSNMIELQILIAKTMKSNKQAKTIVFAIKLFGYACQTINNVDVFYPMEISIPIDSRIKSIYKKQFPNTNHTDTQIQLYFDQLSIKHNIAPLHLDSILWLNYRYKNFKK